MAVPEHGRRSGERHLIAAEPGGWSDPRGLDADVFRQPRELVGPISPPSTFGPTAPVINLTAGQRYYMLEIHHDPSWCGGGFLRRDLQAGIRSRSRRWHGAPADRQRGGHLPGSDRGRNHLHPTTREYHAARWVAAPCSPHRNGSPPATVEPSAISGRSRPPAATTWADIAGATGASYETPILTVADSGAKYRVVCSVPGLPRTSEAATLTVVSDNVRAEINRGRARSPVRRAAPLMSA